MTRSAVRWLVLLLPAFWLLSAGAAAPQPRLAVVESPAAAAWLRSAGLDCAELTGDQFASGPPEASLLILPLDRVRSEAMVRSVASFLDHGGKVIAVYWGTIARPDQQSAFPVYQAAPLLGVRIAGWALVGPAVIRAEMAAVGSGGAMSLGSLSSTQPSNRPAADSGADRLSRAMLIRVDPEPSAQVLARLVPGAGLASTPSEPPLALVVRNGNVFYAAADLFQPEGGAAEMRRLFFWILDQASPGVLYSGVRERAGLAAAAVIQARERLASRPAPGAEAVGKLLTEAEAAAARAKQLAASDDFAGSLAASDQARDLAGQALGLLEGH